MAVLLLAEHDNKTLAPASAKALTAARAFGGDVDILVAGEGCQSVADEAAKLEGVGKVLLADAPQLAHRLAEDTTATILPLMENYTVLLAPATTMGKNVLPRVAALLDVGQISDIVEVKAPDTFVRPIYAGNALETVQTSDKIVVGTVRTTAFSATGEGGSASVETVTPADEVTSSSFVSADITESERPELTAQLRQRLDEWLEEVDAKFPVPDVEFDPAKKAARLERLRTMGMAKLEAEHAEYLDPQWQPNDDWWGSQVITD